MILHQSSNRLDNGTIIGLLGEIRPGYFDTSVTGSFPTLERFDAVEFTQGLFPTKMGIFIRRPSKNDVSMRYFIMGKEINHDYLDYDTVQTE